MEFSNIGVWWVSGDGRTQIIRHCDVAFELIHSGVRVMPIGSFFQIHDYLWLEFPPF